MAQQNHLESLDTHLDTHLSWFVVSSSPVVRDDMRKRQESMTAVGSLEAPVLAI